MPVLQGNHGSPIVWLGLCSCPWPIVNQVQQNSHTFAEKNEVVKGQGKKLFANAAMSLPQHFLLIIKSRKQILNHCGL